MNKPALSLPLLRLLGCLLAAGALPLAAQNEAVLKERCAENAWQRRGREYRVGPFVAKSKAGEAAVASGEHDVLAVAGGKHFAEDKWKTIRRSLRRLHHVGVIHPKRRSFGR